MFGNTLYIIGSKLIGLQFLMSDVFPSLCIKTNRAFFHALGTCRWCRHVLNRSVRTWLSISSILKDSPCDVILSPCLAALQSFYWCLNFWWKYGWWINGRGHCSIIMWVLVSLSSSWFIQFFVEFNTSLHYSVFIMNVRPIFFHNRNDLAFP